MDYNGQTEKGTWQVWYRREPTFRPDDNLTAGNLAETHGRVTAVWLRDANPDLLYRSMQAEAWRPGPARIQQLRAAGIHHASMSVGDVVVSPSGHVWECADFGWTHRGQQPAAA